MANPFYLPQIDYSARDYTAIRDDLIALIPNFAPQWTSREHTDFGIVLIELFSYMGDLLNHYIDRAANEAFINTATQRDTVVGIARMLGYTPAAPVPAQHTVSVTNLLATTDTLYTNALFSTASDVEDTTIYFEYLDEGATIGPNANQSVTVIEGRTSATTQIGISDGTPNQLFPVNASGYVYIDKLVVTVDDEVYTRVSSIVDRSSVDKVYSVLYDSNNVLFIQFGDGVSGIIPPKSSIVSAVYRYGVGAAGNVGANKITNVVSNATSTTSILSVTNNSATPLSYGNDPESTASIRLNAPASLRASERAVALSDYAALAIKGSPYVAKANALADTSSSILLFVAGVNGSFLTASSLSDLKSYFVDRTPPGTLVTPVNYTPSNPVITLDVKKTPTSSSSVVTERVTAALKDFFLFDGVSFGDVIYQADIYKVIIGLQDVVGCTITAFRTVTDTNELNDTMVFLSNEIPIYDSANITINIV